MQNSVPFKTATIDISKGPDFYRLDFSYSDGKKRSIATESFDMSDKRAHRRIVMNLSVVISYVIQKKVWPKDTRVYSDPVKLDNGSWQQNVVGWPEDLTEEQRKQYHVEDFHEEFH